MLLTMVWSNEQLVGSLSVFLADDLLTTPSYFTLLPPTPFPWSLRPFLRYLKRLIAFSNSYDFLKDTFPSCVFSPLGPSTHFFFLSFFFF